MRADRAAGAATRERDELRGLLGFLAGQVHAAFVYVWTGGDHATQVVRWSARSVRGGPDPADAVQRAREQSRSGPSWPVGSQVEVVACDGWQVIVAGLYGLTVHDDVIVVGRRAGVGFARRHIETVVAFSWVLPNAMQRAAGGSPLDDLVTHVAGQLMSASAAYLPAALAQVVRTVAEFFQVDTAFLRRNDHARRVSVLSAEWPVRPHIPDPDPLGVVPFDGPGIDPVFASVKDLKEPLVLRPGQERDYQARVKQGSGAPGVALAMVPILRDEITTGVLGFINFGDRTWSKTEINALRAIASLLSQLEARAEAEERLRARAYSDELTGLANRRALREALAERLSDHDAGQVTVAFLDLDRLKAFNDMLGHAAGDAMLREVAGRLRASTQPQDLVARLGGDEFVLVFHGQPDDPVGATKRIVAAVTAEPMRLGSGTVPMSSISAGVAQCGAGAATAEDLLQRADVALIEAKSSPGQVTAFDERMLTASRKRIEIIRHIGQAVADEALEVHYLPEVDLRDGALIAVEALVRWHHPTLGFLRPAAFIPIAEESPMVISDIGRWVLNRACQQLAAWRAEQTGSPFLLRVNVSPSQLMMVDILPDITAALAAHHLNGEDLCLEVTEPAALHKDQKVLAMLKEIRKLGVKVALDDFGTGYSTLTQLRWLPVDILKIDRQFTRNLDTNAGDAAIVESTIMLANKFGLEVVAEGVESARAARALLRMGCYRAEGHYIRMAGSPEQLKAILKRGGIAPHKVSVTLNDRELIRGNQPGARLDALEVPPA